MINIQFSENEKSELLRFYQFELNKAALELAMAQKKVEDIKRFIDKINVKQNVGATTVRSHHKKVAEAKDIQDNPMIKWVPFIAETLKQQNRLLTRVELLKFAEEKFPIPDRQKAMKGIGGSLRLMVSTGRINVHTKPGDVRNYYGSFPDKSEPSNG
ncbi:MAG: hypothetical protein AABZ32_07940 [Bacteroidota bacterium]